MIPIKNTGLPGDDFMNFMGYRNMVLEEMIEACVSAVRSGERTVTICSDDLSDDELIYLQDEVQRRLGRG